MLPTMQYNINNLRIILIILPIMQYTTHAYNPQIIPIMGIIHGFMYKIQFQIKIFSEICEDPRGAHQFFFSNLQIIL